MIDWNKIESSVLDRYEESLRQCMQSPVYHAEGDAYVHTRMACETLKGLPEYRALDEQKQHVLYVAALLHDIGKPSHTVFANGDWHSPSHAPAGSKMARELLWKDYGLSGRKELAATREAISLLVRYHTFPPFAIEHQNARVQLHRIAANGLLVPDFSIQMLCLLCKADMLGRKSPDQQEMLDKIALCEELAKEEECFEGCYPFPSPHTRRAFLAGRDVWKEQELYDDTWGEVVMMSGLPGTGKDTWIRDHLSDMPVVSLDDIRRANKLPPTANQGLVANVARDQAKDYLRRQQPFVWNATNITPQMRESLVALFETYRARVRVVYLETEWPVLLERNRSRKAAVPLPAIEKMLGKTVPPAPHEARTVAWEWV